MKFTYGGYEGLLDLLHGNGYRVSHYYNWKESEKCVILRHDVDFDLTKALEIAQLESQHSVKSTYFVLLTSNFYNLNSHKNKKIMNEIRGMGHTIGLHFDEMAYPEDIGNVSKVEKDICKELKALSEILETDVTVFSYHRPTKEILDAEISLQGVINSYGGLYFKRFKYLSDSRMFWREPVTDMIRDEGAYPLLHILTHPFWYHDEEKSIKEIVCEFISRAEMERYYDLNDNFTNVSDIIDCGGRNS